MKIYHQVFGYLIFYVLSSEVAIKLKAFINMIWRDEIFTTI